jgi:hypothetical protein
VSVVAYADMGTGEQGTSNEEPWFFRPVRGSLYACGHVCDRLGTELSAFADPQAIARRVARDGDEGRFHITVIHRSQIPLGETGGGADSEAEGTCSGVEADAEEWVMSGTKNVRLEALVKRASELIAPSVAIPETVCAPIPLYVYETRSGATAVSLLFLPGEMILVEVRH